MLVFAVLLSILFVRSTLDPQPRIHDKLAGTVQNWMKTLVTGFQFLNLSIFCRDLLDIETPPELH